MLHDTKNKLNGAISVLGKAHNKVRKYKNKEGQRVEKFVFITGICSVKEFKNSD